MKNPRTWQILASFLLLTSTVGAQSIVWQLPPTDYDSIEPFGSHLYQVTKAGKTGFIRSDGTVVVPPEFDQVTPFHEHKALVVCTDRNRTLVGGYLTDEGEYVAFASPYYTLQGQEFYSDGMLSVTNGRGLAGYLDERGSEAIGFNGHFDIIKPFAEGYAAVFRGTGREKKYALIDKRGTPVRFRLGLGEVYGGTNVFGGTAVIWDTNGKFYTYSTATAECRPSKKPSDSTFDYLYCFSSVSHRTRAVPYTSLPTGIEGLAPTVGPGGLYGYSQDSTQLLPPQFSKAGSFVNGIAVVTLDGKPGLLRWVEDNTDFALSVPKPSLTYQAGSNVTCGFELSLPSAWSDTPVDVAVTDAETGESVDGHYAQGTYSFSFKPHTNTKHIRVAVASQGLLLWTGETTYTLRRQEMPLRVSLAIASDIANKDDQIPVTATITNPGSESVTATVHMTGSAAFVEKHTTVTIPAGGSVQVHSYFHITEDADGQSVQVTTSRGGSASRTGLHFESYI